jgi:MFS family permease
MIGIAAGVQQLWPIVINELVPNKHRGYVNAFMWGTAVPFSVFSPVIARSLITHTSVGWRGCYYIATSITGVTTILFYIFYHPPTFELLHKGRERTWKSILLMIDLGGLFLFTAGMVLFLLGVSWGGQT